MAVSLGAAPAEQTWKKINSQQKHALHIIFNKSKFEHTSELFKSSKILHVYKLNIFNTAPFMHKIQGKLAASIFLPKFRKHSHSYSTRFSHLNYVKPVPKLNKCKYRISYRGPFKKTEIVVITGQRYYLGLPRNSHSFMHYNSSSSF